MHISYFHPAKRKEYDKQRKVYVKHQEEIWLSSEPVQQPPSAASAIEKAEKRAPESALEKAEKRAPESALEKAEKRAPEGKEEREDTGTGRKERCRLDRVLKDFKRNLTSVCDLYELVRSVDRQALYRLNADELRSLNTSIEAVNAAFKDIEHDVEYLIGVFASLKRKPVQKEEEQESSAQLCGGGPAGPKVL